MELSYLNISLIQTPLGPNVFGQLQSYNCISFIISVLDIKRITCKL